MTQKLWSLAEIRDLQIGHDELRIEGEYCAILDLDFRTKRLFVKLEGKEGYEELPVKEMLKEVTGYLAERMTLKKWLRDRLSHLDAKHIVDLHERVEAEGKVIEKRGCYKIVVKGKRGLSAEIEL